MIVLALDSSADTYSLALLSDGEPLAERSWLAPKPHGEGLLASLEPLLADARLDLPAVELVAVATGPGSFNGIRGGIAAAQGLSLALGVPAVGVPTLDALAYAQAGRARAVRALLPAGRGEYYGATYEGDWQDWRRSGEILIAPLDVQLDAAAPGTLLCGRLSDEARAQAAARGRSCVPMAASFARAAYVGVLAALRLGQPDFDRAASLEALYLRRPGITRPNALTPPPPWDASPP